MNHNDRKLIFIGIGTAVLFVSGVGLSLWLTFAPDKEHETLIESTTEIKTEVETPTEIQNPEETANIKELEPLENPYLDEEAETVLTEDEWNRIAMQVNSLLRSFKFSEANELLNEKTMHVPLEEVEYGDELNRLRFDVNNLSFFQPNSEMGFSESMDLPGAVTISQLMQSPERALIAILAAPTQVRVEGILHQQSLVPIFEGLPDIGEVTPYEEGEYLRLLTGSYPDATYHHIDFQVEDYELQAIAVEDSYGVVRIWRIYQEESAAPYQEVAFWKDFYATTPYQPEEESHHE